MSRFFYISFLLMTALLNGQLAFGASYDLGGAYGALQQNGSGTNADGRIGQVCEHLQTANPDPVELANAKSMDDTLIEDDCLDNWPAGVCAACGKNTSSSEEQCQKAKDYYCGKLGWCQ